MLSELLVRKSQLKTEKKKKLQLQLPAQSLADTPLSVTMATPTP